MKNWMTVPTYWDTYKGEGIKFVFDHPTALDKDGDLARMLESFRGFKTKVPVLIIVGINAPDPQLRAHEKVERILKPFAGEMDIFLASAKNLPELNKHVGEGFFSLDTYGNIRNVQYALPYLVGAENVFGIDDDEIINDPEYCEKGLQYLGKMYNGEKVGGMSGGVFGADGEWRYDSLEKYTNEKNMFVKKNYYSNAALEPLMATPDIKKSNVAFGGNTCVIRGTIEKACHDPYIPRGEDFDYALTAMFQGVKFYFYPPMAIIHMPPDSTGSHAGKHHYKLAGDIRRFIYVREKYYAMLKNNPEYAVPVEELMPYPGVFLDKNLDMEKEGVEALVRLYPENFDEQRAIEFVKNTTKSAQENIQEFLKLHSVWQKILPQAADNNEIKLIIENMRVRP